jgi:transposase
MPNDPIFSQSGLGILRIRSQGPDILLDAEGTATAARCPACQTLSSQVHDRYRRRPVDLPWRGRKARFIVTVRRFRCQNESCPRRTFAEDFGEALARYAHRTREATEFLVETAVEAGGEEGARLAAAAGLPVSPDTLLRLIRAIPLPLLPTPRVLGVDDLALRRRYSYATLLVDLETHRVVDLLKERDAETLAGWLKEHPGVEVISRDRAEAYAEGASAGAPKAVQVADRFHLLQNASEALDGMLRGRRLAVEEPDASESTGTNRGPEAETVQLEEVLAGPAPSPTKRIQAERRAARTARWEKVRQSRQAGASISQIAREVGITRRTVRSLLSSPEPPRNRVLRPRPGGLTSPTLAPFVSYLQDRWQQGCWNVSKLFREIQAKGYAGSRSLLAQAVQPWRGPKARLSKKERQRARKLTKRTSMRWICLKPPEKLKADQEVLLEKLLAKNDELARGYDLLQRFRDLLEDRDLCALREWLGDAERSNLPTFMGFANGLKDDWDAVEAALLLPWSNGQLEGQVNRVKLIKRRGYGRAKFDLLRRRVLLSGSRNSRARSRAEPLMTRAAAHSQPAIPLVELAAA